MMDSIISGCVSILVGIVCLLIGNQNMKGNISMLHSYHINNVTEDNAAEFGRIVGIGMIIIAISLIIYGILFILFEVAKLNIYLVASHIVLVIGLVVGLAICLYAIKKYNGKIMG